MAVNQEPSPTSHLEVPHNRKVSINESLHGHDNLAFESPARSRKVSANSEYAETGPVQKKSILHNAHAAENLSLSGHSGEIIDFHDLG